MNIFDRWRKLEADMEAAIAACDHKYIVVTGCARSGTGYMAKVLQAAGLDVPHFKAAGRDGISSDVVVPFPCLDDCLVLHQVRYPLNQISSMQTSVWYTWQYLESLIDMEGMNLQRKCMAYWLNWNTIAQRRADFTYKVEHLDHVWTHICSLAGIENKGLPDVPKNTNTRKGTFDPLTWEQLEKEDALTATAIKDRARLYGYPDYVKV